MRLFFLTFGCWQQIERLAVCHWTGQNYPSRFTTLVFLENNVKMMVPGSSRTSFKKLSWPQGFLGHKNGSLQLDPLDPTCCANLPWTCHGKPTSYRSKGSEVALPRRALQHGATHPEDEFRAQAPTIRSSWFHML